MLLFLVVDVLSYTQLVYRHAMHLNCKKQIYQLSMIVFQIPTGRRQTSWLFTSMTEELIQGLPRKNCIICNLFYLLFFISIAKKNKKKRAVVCFRLTGHQGPFLCWIKRNCTPATVTDIGTKPAVACGFEH